jgi:hypothetical protein
MAWNYGLRPFLYALMREKAAGLSVFLSLLISCIKFPAMLVFSVAQHNIVRKIYLFPDAGIYPKMLLGRIHRHMLFRFLLRPPT